MASVTTYCRICPATCGLQIEVEGGAVTKISGDEHQALSRGFTCTKGRHLADFCTDPARLRTSQRRIAPGNYEDVSPDTAIEEIAARLQDIIATHGPDAVALYTGTQASMASLTLPFTLAFWKTLGSRSQYSSMTVDQSAKWVTEGRLGRWVAGGQRFADADVWMLVGTNPLVTMQGGYFTGFPIHDGLRRLAAEKRRGLQLVVVDPRRTELAARADVHLQIIPGTDAILFAGMLRVILDEALTDSEFCERWVPGLADLGRAVEPFAPDLVATACGVSAEDLLAAARLFGRGRRGMATSGTGPDMGPRANLAEHLIQTLNVVCGRFPRAGDQLTGAAVLSSAKPLPAEVAPPDRHWEGGYRSSSGFGALKGELPSVTLADQILTPGPDRVRALIVSGGNPAVAIPGKSRVIEALSSLDLLVTVDPFMSETAQLADYVIAPVLHLERPDSTRAYESLMDRPFAQYTPAILPRPEGVIDDWEFFLRLAWALGRTLRVAGQEYAPGSPIPSTDSVLASFSARAQVPLDEIKRYPHGHVFDTVQPVRAVPAGPDARGGFDVAPTDIAAELAELADSASRGSPTLREDEVWLIVRRAKEVLNSTGTHDSGRNLQHPNPCHMHPQDLQRFGLSHGAPVSLTSLHGSVETEVHSDATLRPGVVSVTHGFGGPGLHRDPPGAGASTNRLLSLDANLQSISGMPLMTAVPVRVGRLPS